MSKFSEKVIGFVTRRYEMLVPLTIWILGSLPGPIVSIQRGDDWYAPIIVLVIQILASFGSLTLFGVITQLICYHYIKSVEVHEGMMDGLFYGFHAGLVIWILYAFYHILSGGSIHSDINILVGFFGVLAIASCVLGILIGFLIGLTKQGKDVLRF